MNNPVLEFVAHNLGAGIALFILLPLLPSLRGQGPHFLRTDILGTMSYLPDCRCFDFLHLKVPVAAPLATIASVLIPWLSKSLVFCCHYFLC